MADDYSLSDVDRAEARIRLECPTAHVERSNFDFTLRAAKSDLSMGFVVFDCSPDGQHVMISDLDTVVAELKA